MAHRAYSIPTGPLVSIHGEDGSGPTNLNTCSDVPRRLEKSTGVTARLATAPRERLVLPVLPWSNASLAGIPVKFIGISFFATQPACNCTQVRTAVRNLGAKGYKVKERPTRDVDTLSTVPPQEEGYNGSFDEIPHTRWPSICEIWTLHPFMLDDFVIEPKLNGLHVTTSESETSKVEYITFQHFKVLEVSLLYH
jgi:hypothetical protein